MKSTTNIETVDARHPRPDTIARAAALIRRGGVVVVPTTGLYGLAADAFNTDALARIFAIKGRTAAKAILVLIDRMEMLARVAVPPDAAIRHLMEHFWPGGVTFVLPAAARLPRQLTGGSGKIGVRLVRHPVAAALVSQTGAPLTGTSANLSGAGGCASVARIDPAVLTAVDLVLDAGPLAGGAGSTVVDVTGAEPVILREGAVPAVEIMDRFRRRP